MEGAARQGKAMLTKCANPKCFASFRYLHDGKVFMIQGEGAAAISGLRPEQPNAGCVATSSEYYWLCSTCSQTMTIVLDRHKTVRVVSIATLRALERGGGRPLNQQQPALDAEISLGTPK